MNTYADKHQQAYNGFTRESLKENKISYQDSLYLKHMKTMCDNKNLETIIYEGETYTWIDQTKMAEYLDLLGGLRNLQKRIAYFVEIGLFKKHTINRKNNKNGKYSYFATTPKLCSMVSETRKYESCEQNSVESYEQNSQSHTNKIRKGYEQNSFDLTNKIRNKDSFNSDSINKTKKNTPKGAITVKTLHGELNNVLLTDEEYGKLVERFGISYTEDKIETLSAYITSSGKKYQSHYATILSWARREGKAQIQKPQVQLEDESKYNGKKDWA